MLNEEGKLVRTEDPAPIDNGRVLTIPFDFFNFMVLCEHPLSMGKRQGPLFDELALKSTVFNVGIPAAHKTKHYYMEKGVMDFCYNRSSCGL